MDERTGEIIAAQNLNFGRRTHDTKLNTENLRKYRGPKKPIREVNNVSAYVMSRKFERLVYLPASRIQFQKGDTICRS